MYIVQFKDMREKGIKSQYMVGTLCYNFFENWDAVGIKWNF